MLGILECRDFRVSNLANVSSIRQWNPLIGSVGISIVDVQHCNLCSLETTQNKTLQSESFRT